MQTDVRVLKKKKPMKTSSKYQEVARGAGDASGVCYESSDWFKRLARVFWAHL